ncbi:hypothetical protein KR222_004027, partial [Zaprionus bogoriensis]
FHFLIQIELPEPTALPQFLACGYRNENGLNMTLNRSSDSNEANYGEFGWIVAILLEEWGLIKNVGAGSLLAPNIVLTAGHKVFNLTAEDLIARVGEWDRTTTTEIYEHQDIDVKDVILHPEYKPHRNNIALLVLKSSVAPSLHISPICLPEAGHNFDHSQCFAMGWGQLINSSEKYPKVLKKIRVPVVPHNLCQTRLQSKIPKYTLDASYICAGGVEFVDMCIGDGGAPLVCPIRGTPNRYYQAGIVAFGIGCGLRNMPAVYTNVAMLKPWIAHELERLKI